MLFQYNSAQYSSEPWLNIWTYVGVGFEECSAEVKQIEDSDFTNGFFSKPHNSIQSGHWHFFAFQISKDDFHVEIRANLESHDAGESISPVHDSGQLSGLRKLTWTSGIFAWDCVQLTRCKVSLQGVFSYLQEWGNLLAKHTITMISSQRTTSTKTTIPAFKLERETLNIEQVIHHMSPF